MEKAKLKYIFLIIIFLAAYTIAIPSYIYKRSIVSLPVKVAHEPMRPKRLSITEAMTVADTGLMDIAKAVAITVGSKMEVKPLPKGEPGGSVVGRGKDIRGVFRLVRLKHNLADWWADQSSLIALMGWLNTQTQIKTDMNIEGGSSICLTDPKLSKAPLAFFTGHDPTLVTEMKLSYGAPLKGRLSSSEIKALRKYLIEDGGFVFFDDCGVNAATQPFLRLFMAQLRYAMPEYSLVRIPRDHEIYHNYYETGGPPVGYDIFWWGTHPSKRDYLEGIIVGDDLRLLLSSRDYLCSMLRFSIPSRTAHFSPAVYRFATNVVIYALTHGSISDYSHYVPENIIKEGISIEKPIPVTSFK